MPVELPDTCYSCGKEVNLESCSVCDELYCEDCMDLNSMCKDCTIAANECEEDE